MMDDAPRHKRYPNQEFRCEHCDEKNIGRVTVDRLSGVAGASCNHCGKLTEPLPP